jgi:uncharacterized Zn finger protein
VSPTSGGSPANELTVVFGVEALQHLAEPMVLARGWGYADDRHVLQLEASADRASATVLGSIPYDVELRASGGAAWSCTCPYAEDGSLCKHVVAVALVALEEDRDQDQDQEQAPGRPTRAPEPTSDAPRSRLMRDLLDGRREALARREAETRTIADHLASLHPVDLVELLLVAAGDDPRLHDRLLARAQAATGIAPDRHGWRARLEAAFETGGFVPYREAAEWAGGVREAIDLLGELHRSGHHDLAIDLCEHAHRLADRAVQDIDDSGGWLTDISAQLAALHLQACTAAAPDPVELARRLVDLELSSELDGFRRAAMTYAEVLGAAGIAEYRRLLEPRWQELAGSDGWHEDRFTVREARIGAALASGDPDELIEVRRHDLRTPRDHLEVSSALEDAGRTEEAIDWARDGLSRYADRPWQTGPLRDHLARLLRAEGDVAGVTALYRAAFDQDPSLESYRHLVSEAGPDAEVEAERAMSRLRGRLDRSPDAPAVPSGTAAQPLVEILAAEGSTDEAWQVATAHGCDERMWSTLARGREAEHPLDAVRVYDRQVLDLIDQRKTPAYRAAVDLMARVRRLAVAAGHPEVFDDLLQRVRTEHRAKRNLRALLEQRGW